MLNTIAYAIAGLIGLGIIFVGARFLFTPQAAAVDFGVPGVRTTAAEFNPWLAVKAVRDIASGLVILMLLASHAPHLLGGFMLAASIIPIGDGLIVLRSGGPKAAAYGIHGTTALAMLLAGVQLIIG